MTEVPVEIREMELEDAEAVAELSGQLGYERSADQTRAWIRDAALRPNEQGAFVACLDGQVAGWIEVSIVRRLQSEPFAIIGGLVVHGSQRGRGLGRSLCQRAEGWAWERKLARVRVTSRSTREDAHRFYLRDGYEQVKTSLVFEKSREG